MSTAHASTPQATFVVTVQFSIYPEHYVQFTREIVANARASREREPGCVVFDVCEDPAQPGQVFLYEIYTDAAAFDQHMRATHYLEFDRKVSPWVQHKAIKIYRLADR